jgi:hypothetical protein
MGTQAAQNAVLKEWRGEQYTGMLRLQNNLRVDKRHNDSKYVKMVETVREVISDLPVN